MANLAKQITGFNPDKPLGAQYGHNPKTSKRQGLGPWEHYVYPDIFGAGSEDGLIRGAGLAVAPSSSVNSQYLDLSGWSRWTLYFNFNAAIPAGTSNLTWNTYADPGFNNLLLPAGASTFLVFGAGATNGFFDSQKSPDQGRASPTPYLQFVFTNGDAVSAINMQCALFLYNYMAR